MCSRAPHLPFLIFSIATIAFTTTSLAQAITIEKWGDAKEAHFDPKHPPADLPLLARKEPALGSARPWVEWNRLQASRGLWERKSHTLTIETVADVTLKGHTDLLLPDDATAALRAHELGHDRVNAGEWDRVALSLATEALMGFKGMTFVGEGADDEARRADAWKKADAEYARRMAAALEEINRQLDVAGDRFDELTDHGRSKTVDADRGVETVRKERATTRPARPN